MIRLKAFVQYPEPKELIFSFFLQEETRHEDRQRGNFKIFDAKRQARTCVTQVELEGDVRIIELGDIIECNCRRWLAI